MRLPWRRRPVRSFENEEGGGAMGSGSLLYSCNATLVNDTYLTTAPIIAYPSGASTCHAIVVVLTCRVTYLSKCDGRSSWLSILMFHIKYSSKLGKVWPYMLSTTLNWASAFPTTHGRSRIA